MLDKITKEHINKREFEIIVGIRNGNGNWYEHLIDYKEFLELIKKDLNERKT